MYVVSFSDLDDVTTTFLYIFVNSSTVFCTLGLETLVASCRHKNTNGSNFPDIVIAYRAVYECVILLALYRCTNTVFVSCVIRIRSYVD